MLNLKCHHRTFTLSHIIRYFVVALFALSAHNVSAEEKQFVEQEQLSQYERLLTAAQEHGSVKVIIGLRAPPALPAGFKLDARLPNNAARLEQRATIHRMQDNVLASLPWYNRSTLKRFHHFPYLVAEVDVVSLQSLHAHSDVTSVQEDSLLWPLLADSVPLIGADDVWGAGYNGSGQAVAILDTGVDSLHIFLAGKVISEACYSTTDDYGTSLCPNGADAQTGPGSGVNCTGITGCDHGTHNAGIAAGQGASFSGVARGADLISIQVFSRINTPLICGSGNTPCLLSWTSDLISGLERVYALRNTFDIASVNLRLGGV